MDANGRLAERFEAHRARLRAVAYRMLGSLAEADDAVQETWLRLGRAGGGEVDNLGGWLTTVVARVCLDLLRARASRGEQPLDPRLPDPVVEASDGLDPEHEALLAEGVGLALQIVLETLTPAERLAFVLHDLFAIPFDEVAPVLRRSPAAARQLASRARRRVRDATPASDPDRARQRQVVDAFLAAARGGDLDGLVAVLDPDVVLRAEHAGALTEVRGAAAVARSALGFAWLAGFAHPVTVNGTAGLVAAPKGRPFSVLGFTVAGGRIVELDILADPARLRRLGVTVPDG
jgi:RNA polymerase sigma factor (sigma-70 family)